MYPDLDPHELNANPTTQKKPTYSLDFFVFSLSMLSEDESRFLAGQSQRRLRRGEEEQEVGEQDTTDEGRFKRGLDSSIAVLSAELTQDETIY
jgi:hypothetical protein